MAKRKEISDQAAKRIFVTLFILIAAIAVGWNGFGDLFPQPTPFQWPEYTMDATDAAPALGESVQVHFIDVGQGDAVFIQGAQECVLIDSGPGDQEEAILNYLEEQRVETIDLCIATHPHEDHIGNMAQIINRYHVKAFAMPDKTATTEVYRRMLLALQEEQIKPQLIRQGSEFLFSDFSIHILSPISDSYEETNDYSTVARLTVGDTAFLLTGDAEESVEKEILQSGQSVRAQVLKVGHHGSSTSTSKAFLEAVDPEYGVISCSKDNSYGHPNKETLMKLAAQNVEVLRTDEVGDIVFSTDGKRIERVK